MAKIDIGGDARIYTRDEWGARDWRDYTNQTDLQLREVFLHHSDHARAEVLDRWDEQVAAAKGMQDYHQFTKGWDDIGYHWIVYQQYGNVEVTRILQGRPVNHVPAAQEGHNTGTVAICTVGNFQGDDQVKAKTVTAIVELIKHVKANNADRIVTVGGHRDVVQTSCPGAALYREIPEIARRTGLRRY
jgi:N-acetylmuramoyl-L-alanine amidase